MNKNLIIGILLLLSIVLVWRYSKNSYIERKENEKILVVGTNAEFPPFTFIQDGEIVGFDIDVINEVAKRLDKKIIIKDMPFDSLIIEAMQGRIQVIAAGMTATKERQQQIFFTSPYLSGDPLVIITKADTEKIHSMMNLYGKDVIVNEGFTSDLYMSNISGPNLIRVSNPAEAFLALQSGQVFAFVAALSSLEPFFKTTNKELFTITPIEGAVENCSLGISKKYPQLYKEIEAVIKKMIEDGTISTLKTKWAIA